VPPGDDAPVIFSAEAQVPLRRKLTSHPCQGGIVSIGLQAQDARPTQSKRRHLLIAGTGRAGTSFLVRFLAELGLETHISRFGEDPWDDAAQAGLEDLPVAAGLENLPYIFKTPWAYQFIEQMLADSAIAFDAVIIPMRDLAEAAASRSIVQLQAIHGRAPWMTQMDNTWEDWGDTAGGAVFSLNPVDQSRLLAAGFHRLVNRLVQAEVPLIFVAFPRIVQDTDYLIGKLRPVIPASVTLEQARQSHRRVADAALVRVGQELSQTGERHVLPAGSLPTLKELDNVALRRELVRLRDRLAATEAARLALARSQLVRRLFNRCRRTVRAILQNRR
jgi:hypothetical protein